MLPLLRTLAADGPSTRIIAALLGMSQGAICFRLRRAGIVTNGVRGNGGYRPPERDKPVQHTPKLVPTAAALASANPFGL